MAEWFAVMPVLGVRSGSASRMYFKWASVRAIYCAIVFSLMAGLTILTMFVTFRGNVEFDSVGKFRAVSIS